MEMPKFDFSGCEFQDDAELQAALDAEGKGSKFFKPGRYEVTIDEVKYEGQAKDPNWGKLSLVYKGTGDKEQKDFLSIPFKTFKFKNEQGKESLYPFKKVKAFCSALGVEVAKSNVGDAMKSVFGRPEKLKGRPLVVNIGYTRAHAHYAGKEDGAPVYNLALRDGGFANGTDGQPLKFPDHAAVEAYATAEKIPYDKYTSILSYEKSSAAAPSVDSTPW